MGRKIFNLVNEFPMALSGNTEMMLDDVKRLWIGVMDQALFDSSYGLHRYYKDGKLNFVIDKKEWSPHSTLIRYYKESQQWFIVAGPDFKEVCGILNLNPGVVQVYAVDMFKEINKHVSNQWKIRNGSFKLV